MSIPAGYQELITEMAANEQHAVLVKDAIQRGQNPPVRNSRLGQLRVQYPEAAALIDAFASNEFDPGQPRDESGKWTSGGASAQSMEKLTSETKRLHESSAGWSYNPDKINEALTRGLREDDVYDMGLGRTAHVLKGGDISFRQNGSEGKKANWKTLPPEQQDKLRVMHAYSASRTGVKTGTI